MNADKIDDGWFSIYDCLPNDSRRIMIMTRRYGIMTGRFENSRRPSVPSYFEVGFGHDLIFTAISHWRELPPEPKSSI